MFIDNVTKSHLITQFMHKVYGWMSVGLLTTAGVAYTMFHNIWLMNAILQSSLLFYGLFFAQIGLVIYLQSSLATLSYQRASGLFLLYSALIGVTLSPIFVIYTMASIAQTFVVAAGMFASMALYGYITKDDLTKFGNLFMMGLFGLIIAQVANRFFASTQFDYYLSLLGVVLFALLTAYDVQKLKHFGVNMLVHQDNQMGSKIALMGALTLYLDFINLFLRLLRLMGRKRN